MKVTRIILSCPNCKCANWDRLNAGEYRCTKCNKVYDPDEMLSFEIEENITTDYDKYIDFLSENWNTFESEQENAEWVVINKAFTKNSKTYYLTARFNYYTFVEGYLSESSSSEFIINGSGGFSVETFIDFVKRAFKEM